MSEKKTLCVDFDGVLHSYASGWQGAATITDPPVPGALEWLVEMTNHYEVAIYSTRSASHAGRRAMRKWLRAQLTALAPSWKETPRWLQDVIAAGAFGDPWEDEVQLSLDKFIGEIVWPKSKPSAWLTIDDRAVCFTGIFPTRQEIDNFLPWYKKPQSFYEKGRS